MDFKELAQKIGTQNGCFLYEIGFLPESKRAYMFYKQSLIQKAVFHEDLFSLYLAWTAILSPFDNSWIWFNRPTENGGPAQIYDVDVSGISPMPDDENELIIRVSYRLSQGDLVHIDLDPSSMDRMSGRDITAQNEPEQQNVVIEQGKWIIFPGHQRKPLRAGDVADLRK